MRQRLSVAEMRWRTGVSDLAWQAFAGLTEFGWYVTPDRPQQGGSSHLLYREYDRVPTQRPVVNAASQSSLQS